MAGRPSAIQDLQQLKDLMRFNPLLKDVAAFFDCSGRTVQETIRVKFDQTFEEFRDAHMVHTRIRLIDKALEKAYAGDNTMLKFCLVNLCGWSDKPAGEGTVIQASQITVQTIDLEERAKQLKGK